jgi:stage II sporulation protein D
MTLFRIGSFFAVVLLSVGVFADQSVNVAIASGSQISVSGKAIKVYGDGEKSLLKSDHLKISMKGNGVVVNGKRLDAPLRLLSDEPVKVGTKKVKGELDVLVQQGTMTIVHPILLEEYVAGIVASEMPKTWPLEALKAQAIASRTYALYQKYRRLDKGYHLDSTVLDQVYGGLERDHERAAQAAKETQGLVLTYDSKPIVAYFHSTCGGQTASALEGWGSDLPYLPGSTCGYCTKDGKGEWKYSVSMKAMEKAIGTKNSITSAALGSLTRSGRVKEIELGIGKKKMEMPMTDLRQRLGYSNLRSTVLERVAVGRNDVTFYGRGFGHGVGMCQWGARGMAEEGFVASQILSRYYPGTELRQVY